MFPYWHIILAQDWAFQADLPLLRFNHSWQLRPTQPLSHCPCTGMGERIWRLKMRKTYGLKKREFITQGSAAHPGKAKQGIRSSLPLGRLAFSYPQESKVPGKLGPITLNTDLRRKTQSFQIIIIPNVPRLPPCSSHFIYWAWGHIIWNIPLISWCQLCKLCSSQLPV